MLTALAGLACQSNGNVRSATPPVIVPASQTAPGPAASQSPAAVLTAGPLTVTVTAPADETVVDVPQVDLLGQAPPDAVISINDIVLVVGPSGQFSATVPLQEGPNEIDVVASDADGNEASTQLIVTYEAPG